MAKTPSTPDDTPALAGALNERVEDLRKLVRQVLRSWDTDAIHQARVTTRRLKAAVDVLRPLLSDEPRREFAKSLRRLRRMLGPLRDLDVMLLHLGDLRAPPGCGEGVTWVSHHMRQRREDLRRRRAREHSAREVLGWLGAWVDLEGDVRESQDAASVLLREVAPVQVRAFADRADAVVRQAEGGPPPVEGPPAAGASNAAAEDVHELRIAGKLLRYTLELAEPLGHRVPRQTFRTFKKLQDELGLWHDFVVLSDEMLRLALESELSIHHSRTYGSVLQLARLCWERSERHLRQFTRLWSRHGAALVTGVEGVFTNAPGDSARHDKPQPGENGSGDLGTEERSGDRAEEAVAAAAPAGRRSA